MSPINCLILLLLGEAASLRIAKRSADSPGEKALISSGKLEKSKESTPSEYTTGGESLALGKPEGISLENLVHGERKCRVQGAFGASLKHSIENGSLHKVFAGSNVLNVDSKSSSQNPVTHSKSDNGVKTSGTVLTLDNPLLSGCRALDNVCKVPTASETSKCSNTDFANLANLYLKFSLCSAEAALNQLYVGPRIHVSSDSSKDGSLRRERVVSETKFTYTLLDKRIASFSRGASDEKTKLIYERSAKALTMLRSLFHDCEEALVSPAVQHVLFNRWKIFAKTLCSLANGADAGLVSSTFVDPGSHSVRMVIDAEDFLNEAVKTFVHAYKPFEALLDTLQKSLLAEIIKLAEDGYDNKVAVLTSLMNAKHNSSVDKSALESMVDIPTSGIHLSASGVITPLLSESLLEIKKDSAGATGPMDDLKVIRNVKDNDRGDLEVWAALWDQNYDKDAEEERGSSRPSREALASVKSHNSTADSRSGTRYREYVPTTNVHNVTHVEEKRVTISPTAAIKSVLVSLGIFKIKENSLEAKLDEEAISNAVKSALLDVDDERMLGKLIVAPQAALYSIYSTIDQMLLSPETNDQIGEMKKGKMVELKGKIVDQVEKFSQTFEGLYDQVRKGVKEAGANVTSALELDEDVEGATFILVSSSSGAKVSSIDESSIEGGALVERSLLHINTEEVRM